MTKILGIAVDASGRCQHWHQDFDIIANQCELCQEYFACYLCNDSLRRHAFQPAPLTAKSVRCGNCGFEMTGTIYLKSTNCPQCQHAFNPKCHLHQAIYFQ